MLPAAVAVVAGVLLFRRAHRGTVYAEYDREFRAYLANATQIVGKETIKVERLSDRFTVPQKLTIKGTPYEIGLTIGHVGRQARRTPAPAGRDESRPEPEARRPLSEDLPASTSNWSGAWQTPTGSPRNKLTCVLFERDFTSAPLVRPAPARAVLPGTDFGKHGDPSREYGCSVASYYANGHQIVGRNFDLASDRPHYFADLEMAGTYKVMGHTVYDITGEVDDGINEKGLSLCVAANIGVDGERHGRRQGSTRPASPIPGSRPSFSGT